MNFFSNINTNINPINRILIYSYRKEMKLSLLIILVFILASLFICSTEVSLFLIAIELSVYSKYLYNRRKSLINKISNNQ